MLELGTLAAIAALLVVDLFADAAGRAFNDLARAAEVESVITRSISGHLTEQMQLHYSTVNPDEQKRSIGKVIDLMQVKAQRAGGAPTPPSGAPESTEKEQLSDAPKQAGGAPSGAPVV